jgi:hypothetical protein
MHRNIPDRVSNPVRDIFFPQDFYSFKAKPDE